MLKTVLSLFFLISIGLCVSPYIITDFLLQDSGDSIIHKEQYPFDLTSYTPTGPDKVSEGVLYTRVKIDSSKYVVSRGQLNKFNYQTYKAFKIENLKPWEIVKTRFFKKNKSYPEEDLKLILINGQYIYALDVPFLYYNNAGIWSKLYPEKELPVQINIISTPPGVTVAIDGHTIGLTPLSYSGLRAEYYHVLFSKEGFYRHEIPVKTDTSLLIYQHVKLKEKISVYDAFSDTLNLRELSDSNKIDIWTFYKRTDYLEARLAVLKKASKGLEEQFESRYPLLNPGLFKERNIEFNKRKKRYLDDKALQLKSLKEEFRLKLIRYKETLTTIKQTIFAREFIQINDTLDFKSLKNFKQKQGKKDHVEFDVDKGIFNFSYKGKGWDFNLKEKSSYANLEIWGWNLQVKDSVRNKAYSIGIDSLFLLVEKEKYFLRGNVQYSAPLRGLPYFSKISSKIKLYSDSLKAFREAQRKEKDLKEIGRVQKIIAMKKAHRKKAVRWVTGLAFTAAGTLCGVLAWQSSNEADTFYKKYPDVLTTSSADSHREKVEQWDKKADLYSTLSVIGFSLGFVVLTF